jgi:hypothetical protein
MPHRDLSWARFIEPHEPLEITADTIACEWDGRPVRYGWVIDDLVRADGLT